MRTILDIKNRRNIYVGQLNDKLIKAPRQTTLDYYKVEYDKKEGICYWVCGRVCKCEANILKV